jgi:hypothetical protein
LVDEGMKERKALYIFIFIDGKREELGFDSEVPPYLLLCLDISITELILLNSI